MLPLSNNARKYILEELLRRLGFIAPARQMLSTRVRYADPGEVDAGQADLIIVPCAPDAADRLLSLPPASLGFLPPASVVPPGSSGLPCGPLPVLFWGAGREFGACPFAEHRSDGAVVVNADLLASSFFMLTRWEESLSAVRDEHGRFTAAASVAFLQGFLDRPVVDEYALVLGEWLRIAYPGLEIKPHPLRIRLSHDIDAVTQTDTVRAGIRQVLDYAVSDHRYATAARTMAVVARLREDPYAEGIFRLARLSLEYGFHSVFNVMAASPGAWDNGYSLSSPLAHRILRFLLESGFEIGFHASYHTADDLALFLREKEALDSAIGSRRHGGRQHYLRFTVPATWRCWEEAGLAYDSTVGFADHEGFRAGTAWSYRPFDIERDRQMNLWEHPLVVMDATLRCYRKLSPGEAQKIILKLVDRTAAVGGTFTMLWHNSSFSDEWTPWGKMYAEILRELSPMKG